MNPHEPGAGPSRLSAPPQPLAPSQPAALSQPAAPSDFSPRRRALLVGSVLGATGVAGCGGGGAQASGEVGFTTLYQGDASSPPDAQTAVVRDGGVWLAFWAKFAGNAGGLLPLIDFDTKMVVAVFLGMRPNACYSVSITEAIGGPAGLTIGYRENTPAAGAICAQVTTSPAHIIVVDARASSVQFVKKPE